MVFNILGKEFWNMLGTARTWNLRQECEKQWREAQKLSYPEFIAAITSITAQFKERAKESGMSRVFICADCKELRKEPNWHYRVTRGGCEEYVCKGCAPKYNGKRIHSPKRILVTPDYMVRAHINVV